MTLTELENQLDAIIVAKNQKSATSNFINQSFGELRSSALSAGDRLKYGFADDWGKKQIIANAYKYDPTFNPNKDIIPLPNGEYGVRTPMGIKPVDPKGFQVTDLPGDILESVGKGLTTGGAIAGGILGGVTGPGAIAATSLGATAGESARQYIGKEMGVRKNYDLNEIALETALAGVSELGGQFAGRALQTGGKKLGDLFKSNLVKEGVEQIDNVTGLKIGVPKNISTGETFATLTGNKADDDLLDYALKKIKKGETSDLDFRVRGGLNRANRRIGEIIDQRVIPGVKYIDQQKKAAFKQALDNLPEGIKQQGIDTSPFKDTLDELLDPYFKTDSLGRKSLDRAALSDARLGKLGTIYDELKKGKPISIQRAEQLKNQLSDMVNWDAVHNLGKEGATALDNKAAKLYGSFSGSIADKLGLVEANAQYAKTSRMMDDVLPIVRGRNPQRLLNMITKDPDSRLTMFKRLQAFDDMLPEDMKFMPAMMNTQASKLLSDIGFTGSSAGSPKTLLQKYVFTPGGLLRMAKLGSDIGKTPKQLTALLKKLPYGKETLQGLIKQSGAVSARTKSLNSILYGGNNGQ